MLMVALSLSIGWGIRGNFGHEIGAMLPGAMAAMAVAILSGRADWQRRVAFFGAAGAIGWSLGGSMSYMQVIGYTHSGDSLTVIYGYACLFLLGFLWAAPGGMAVALPALLDRERLTSFFAPLVSIAVLWTLTSLAVGIWDQVDVDFRQGSPLYWYDTSWLEALGVIVAVVGWVLIRRRLDFASSLLLHAAVGWWIAFLVLVPGFGLRMTPPRGDNWAGAIGIVVGLWIFCYRHGLSWVNETTWVTGIIGGFGFTGATLVKLLGIATGFDTNWHSVLEQTYGLINGLGVAFAMFRLARVAPLVSDASPVRTWTEPWAAGLAVFGVTYLNLRQNSEFWVKAKAIPSVIYGIPAWVWHEAAWVAAGIALYLLLRAHRRQPLAVVPETWLGIGQGLFLALLWAMVLGNLLREITAFTPQRLVTEGVIHLNTLICTVGILRERPGELKIAVGPGLPERGIMKFVIVGIGSAILCVVFCWGITRSIYGDRPAGYSSLHIRFGPHANSPIGKPPSGQPHP